MCSDCATSRAGQGTACDHSILLGGLAVLIPETLSDSSSAEKVVVPCFFFWEAGQGESSKYQGCINHHPVSVKHHRLDWQLHQLQLWGHGTLCSGGKTGTRTWIEVQIQIHNHTRLRADPCHHWKRRLCEYGCSLHFQTERVKFFRTVLRGPELTDRNLLNFVFTYCWRCNYWCSNWPCATVPVGPAITLTVFWPGIFTTWAYRIRTEQSWGSCQELGPWGDNSMHSKGCLMLLGFCRWPWLTKGCNPLLSQYIKRARPLECGSQFRPNLQQNSYWL